MLKCSDNKLCLKVFTDRKETIRKLSVSEAFVCLIFYANTRMSKLHHIFCSNHTCNSKSKHFQKYFKVCEE